MCDLHDGFGEVDEADWEQDVYDFAEDLMDLYARYPRGHRLHDTIPGTVATLVLGVIPEGVPAEDFHAFLYAAHEEAGLDEYYAELTCEALSEGQFVTALRNAGLEIVS